MSDANHLYIDVSHLSDESKLVLHHAAQSGKRLKLPTAYTVNSNSVADQQGRAVEPSANRKVFTKAPWEGAVGLSSLSFACSSPFSGGRDWSLSVVYQGPKPEASNVIGLLVQVCCPAVCFGQNIQLENAVRGAMHISFLLGKLALKTIGVSHEDIRRLKKDHCSLRFLSLTRLYRFKSAANARKFSEDVRLAFRWMARKPESSYQSVDSSNMTSYLNVREKIEGRKIYRKIYRLRAYVKTQFEGRISDSERVLAAHIVRVELDFEFPMLERLGKHSPDAWRAPNQPKVNDLFRRYFEEPIEELLCTLRKNAPVARLVEGLAPAMQGQLQYFLNGQDFEDHPDFRPTDDEDGHSQRMEQARRTIFEECNTNTTVHWPDQQRLASSKGLKNLGDHKVLHRIPDGQSYSVFTFECIEDLVVELQGLLWPFRRTATPSEEDRLTTADLLFAEPSDGSLQSFREGLLEEDLGEEDDEEEPWS